MAKSWNAEIEESATTEAESKHTGGFDDSQIGVLPTSTDGNVSRGRPDNLRDWVREVLARPNGFGPQ
jgi:hypothetical protein